MNNLSKLYSIIQYKPVNEDYFITSLTHSSCKLQYNYERMEFLGDAVLELISSDFLYHSFPDLDEGGLSKLRSELVCESALFEWAKNTGFGDCIYLGKGEEATGGRSKPSILSDAVEAVIAAIYLDGGYNNARLFAERILNYLLKLHKNGMIYSDAKTKLQEILQSSGYPLPTYLLKESAGEPHCMTFTVSVKCRNTEMGTGSGSSKKQAEQNAARNAIDFLMKKQNINRIQ